MESGKNDLSQHKEVRNGEVAGIDGSSSGCPCLEKRSDEPKIK